MGAFKAAVFLHLASVWFLVSCAPNEQNYSKVNCKILPVGENLASEFELKASEKGVRMIYLNLKIGNDSYNPLELQDEILPDRWVWAKSNREPMLSLPYDYDILSFGLLNYQVRSMTVPLRDQPNGCLAELNSKCQNMAVGKALLDNVTRDRSGEISRKAGVVCVAMIEKDVQTDESSIKYHCCSANPPMVMVYCGLPVEVSNWFSAVETFLGCLSVVVLQYFPALLLILPDCIFNLQEECDKEDCTEDQLTNSEQAGESIAIYHTINGYEQIQNEEEGRLTKSEIPVDDASPVTCLTLLLGYVQRLPVRLSFNVKLAVLLFCITPFVLYVQLGFYLTLKQKYIHECFMKSPQDALPFYFDIRSFFTIFFLSVLAFTSFMLVFCLRPKDLLLQKEKAMKGCPACMLAQSMSITRPFITENATDSINICDKIDQHFKLLQEVVYFLMSSFLKLHNSGLKLLTIKFNTCSLLKKINRYGSRVIRALLILWRLVSTLSTLFFGLVLGAICLLLLVVALYIFVLFVFSPFLALFIFFIRKLNEEMKASFRNRQFYCLLFVFCLIYALLLEFSTFLIVLIICNFILGMLGFTIMGLVLNVEIVTPYVALFLVVTTNMYFCYANLQSRYKEVKGFILKYWQQELQTNKNYQNTIPAKLFWFVCDRAFPVKTEICLMFRNMSVILTFLYLAISSIIFFGNTYDISSLVSTIAVFISGVIPSLFLKGLTRGNNFTGWGKIKLEREIETAVKEYLRQSGRNESEEGRPLDDNSVVV